MPGSPFLALSRAETRDRLHGVREVPGQARDSGPQRANGAFTHA